MNDSSTSSNWPLLAKLRPQLRQHACTYPQTYRGQRWYVLRDQSTGCFLRFNASAYEFIGRLDGDLRVEGIWRQICDMSTEETLTQDDIVLILTQLFAVDLLKSDLPTDAKAFFERFQQQRRLTRRRAIMNPLAIRVPLLDPDQLLNRLLPWVKPLFSRAAGVLWLLVVGFAVLLGLTNVTELSAEFDSSILAPANLLLMLLMFIGIKIIHEFAHAFTVKMWGGEVHEMGITLLVLAPVPYVDATAAWGFRDRHKRILVSAVGVLTELFFAALALFVWLAVEPGLVRDAAFDALLICSVSTLLFNANPLLRFDGYYVLQDLIEIPNLYTRASRYYLYLIKRYLFGLEQARSPVTAQGEAGWFAVYGLTAFLYRLVILVVIVLFLAESYLFIGVALGTWAIAMQLLLPLIRGIRFLLAEPALAQRRVRAITSSVVVVAGLSACLLLVPVSLSSSAEGVVWVSDQARIYAAADGFVTDVLVPSGTEVVEGTAVVRMRSMALNTSIAKLRARQKELQVRYAAERLERRVDADITKFEISTVSAELATLVEQQAALLVTTVVSGTFVLPQGYALTGRYLRQGEVIGYVINPQRLIVRAVVPQTDIGLLREQVIAVNVRLAERLYETVPVIISRETPAAGMTLPSRALGSAGGGSIAVNMSDMDGLTTTRKVFQVDLDLPDAVVTTGIGARAYVRFDHAPEPLAKQWWRSGRQLLLSRLSF